MDVQGDENLTGQDSGNLQLPEAVSAIMRMKNREVQHYGSEARGYAVMAVMYALSDIGLTVGAAANIIDVIKAQNQGDMFESLIAGAVYILASVAANRMAKDSWLKVRTSDELAEGSKQDALAALLAYARSVNQAK